jgi:hypothetical protein
METRRRELNLPPLTRTVQCPIASCDYRQSFSLKLLYRQYVDNAQTQRTASKNKKKSRMQSTHNYFEVDVPQGIFPKVVVWTLITNN